MSPSSEDFFVNTLFSVFKDPTRRKILHFLRHSPLTADEITQRVGVSRPAIEKHLRQMMGVGLIERTADSFPSLRYLYSISSPGLDLISNLEDCINSYLSSLFGEYSRRLEDEEQRYLLGYSSKERYLQFKEVYNRIIDKLKRVKKFQV